MFPGAFGIPSIGLAQLAEKLAPFLGDFTALKPQNTRFVATSWNSIIPPPSDYYFTNIQPAIDSITDQSPTNQYMIIVFPGMYEGAALLSEERQLQLKKQVNSAMLDAKIRTLNRRQRGRDNCHNNTRRGSVHDFSAFAPEAATTIFLKPNVSLCGFALPSATFIIANMVYEPTSEGDTVALSNLYFIESDFLYTNMTPATARGVTVFSECAFLGGSMTTTTLQEMDSFNFFGGFIGFGVMSFGPAGQHSIDHTSSLLVGTCIFTGDTGLGLAPLVRYHAPGTLIESGMTLSQGATLELMASFFQAFGSGIQMDTDSLLYASFSHINAASFNALNNSKVYLSNTPASLLPTVDATSACDRTLSTAKMTNVPSGLSQPVTFASLGLPNYVTNSYQVILNFQLTPVQVGALVTPVFVQVDDGSMTTTGFNISTNAVILAITLTFVQDNILMQD